ncbi:MAG: VCBS repeat-containing protein [Gemmataceae bacterium]|nr:VCBS repeat-containing protein [Gemmataceae bacterium]
MSLSWRSAPKPDQRPMAKRGPPAGVTSARRCRLLVERLEDRTLPSGTDFASATLLAPGTVNDSLSGMAIAGYWKLTPAQGGRLTAQVHGIGIDTRLSLLRDDGGLLIESDAQSATDPDDSITQYLSPGTYYLRIDALTALPGDYTLTTQFQVSSAPFQVTPVGGMPYAVAVADLDQDGHADVATANFDTKTVSVLYGLGDGTFLPPQDVALASGPTALVVADVNGDHRLDIVTAAPATNSVTVLLRQADGSFLPMAEGPFVMGATPLATAVKDANFDSHLDVLASLVVADVNGDDRLDLVTTNEAFAEVSVRLGNAGGSFDAPIVSAVGDSNPAALVVGDFNRDGHLDLATANLVTINQTAPAALEPRSVSILFGQGDGHFVEAYRIAVSGGLTGVSTADLDADGYLDLITTQDPANTVAVRLGQAGGLFGAERRLDVGRRPGTVLARDIDCDGRLDLAVVNLGSGDVSVLLGIGDGTFDTQRLYQVGLTVAGNFPGTLAVGDLNGDGPPELVTGNQALGTTPSPRSITVLINVGDGGFQEMRDFGVGDAPSLPITADFNGDGRLDIAVPNVGSNDVSILLGQGNGTFADQLRFAVGTAPRLAAVADFNRDGRPDLVVNNTSDGDVSVLLGIGDGTFQAQRRFATGSQPYIVKVDDLNGDGFLDLVVINRVAANVAVLLGMGDGTFAPARTFDTGALPTALALGDLNGDGVPDVVVANNGSSDVSVLLGGKDVSGAWTILPQLRFVVGAGPAAVVLADVDGDHRLDVLTANRGGKTVSLCIGIGQGPTWTLAPDEGLALKISPTDTPPTPIDLTVADLNLDGLPDLIVANGSGAELTILLGQTSTPSALTARFFAPRRFGVAGTIIAPVGVVAGKFNGDDLPDVAFSTQNQRAVSILVGQRDSSQPGGWTFAAARNFTVATGPVSVVPGDFDADGNTDLATANKFSDDVSVLLGLGDGSFLASRIISNPVRATPLIADLNWDGVADLVVCSANGQILYRQGRMDRPATFDPAILVNPAQDTEARAVAAVALGSRSFLAALDADGRTLSFYRLGRDGTFERTVGPVVPGALASQLTAGDLDNDGRGDLVVAAAGSSQVFVYFQRATGGFGLVPDRTIAVGVNPAALKLVDVDGDGFKDILVADQFSADVAVISSSGTAPFSTSSRFRASTSPYGLDRFNGATVVRSLDATMDVAAGLVDADGIVDLIVVNAGADTISVLPGTGHGGFANPSLTQTYATGLRPTVVVTGQFDGDARPELAVLDEGSGELQVFDVAAAGTLVRTGVFSAGNQATGVTVADMNRDGRADLVIGNAFGDVLILLGNGDGTFQTYQRTDRSIALAVTDLNGDGRADFVLADSSLDRVIVHYSQAGQSFQQGAGDGLAAPAALAAADLNRDGVNDLIVVNTGGNDIRVYLGLGGGQFGSAQRFFAGTSPAGVTLRDLDGDGFLDLVVANQGSNDVSILLAQGSLDAAGHGTGWTLTYGPRLNAGFDSVLDRQVGLGPVATAIADVNVDGALDLLVSNRESNNVSLLLGTGNGFFNDQRPTIFAVGSDPVEVFVGDFDTTPGLDLVTVNAGSDDLSFISHFTAPGAQLREIAVGDRPVQAVVGDFNGDSTLDLVVANNRDGVFSLLLGGADGPSLARTMSSADVAHPTSLALAGASDGLIDLYATAEGRETVFRLSFDLNPIPVPSPNDPGTPPDSNPAGGTVEATRFGPQSASDLNVRPLTTTLLPLGGVSRALVAALVVAERAASESDGEGLGIDAGTSRFIAGLDNVPLGSHFADPNRATGTDGSSSNGVAFSLGQMQLAIDAFLPTVREATASVVTGAMELAESLLPHLDLATKNLSPSSLSLPWRAILDGVLGIGKGLPPESRRTNQPPPARSDASPPSNLRPPDAAPEAESGEHDMLLPSPKSPGPPTEDGAAAFLLPTSGAPLPVGEALAVVIKGGLVAYVTTSPHALASQSLSGEFSHEIRGLGDSCGA